MNATEHSAPTFDDPAVVVGVDGTHIALDAVRWAAGEARLRRLPLRIVHAAPYAAGHDAPAVRRAHDISARAFTVARRTEPDVRSSTSAMKLQATMSSMRSVPRRGSRSVPGGR